MWLQSLYRRAFHTHILTSANARTDTRVHTTQEKQNTVDEVANSAFRIVTSVIILDLLVVLSIVGDTYFISQSILGF